MPVTGTKIVANNIIRYGGGFLKTVDQVMREIKFLLDRQVTKNLSRDDYSLQDLADLDHPFASRHGGEGRKVYEPYWMVHKRSGKLLRSKKSGTVKASITSGTLEASAFVGLDPSRAPHAEYVVFGTSRMIPRPVLTGSRDQVSDEAFKLLRKVLRNLTINFKAR